MSNKIKIELPSRYKDVHTVIEQTDNPNVFNVKTDSNYVRTIHDGEKDVEDVKIKHIDFEGGPFISLGNDTLWEGHTLKGIDFSLDNNCYQFIFDDKHSNSE